MNNFNDLVSDERIKNVFWFISKARRLGFFLVVGSCILAAISIRQYQYNIESKINVIVLIIAMSLGVANIIRPTTTTYLISSLLYLFVLALNVFVFIFTRSPNIIYIIVGQTIISVVCIKIFLKSRTLKITNDDRDKFKQILKSFRNFKKDQIKIKVYNMVESKIWKCIIVDKVILITTRYKSELYVSDKNDFIILETKVNKLTKSVKGNLMLNGEMQKFIMSNNAFETLNTMLA